MADDPTTTAATVTLTLTRRERIILAYALRHYANALDAEDFATDGYDGPLETSADCRALSDKVRDA